MQEGQEEVWMYKDIFIAVVIISEYDHITWFWQFNGGK